MIRPTEQGPINACDAAQRTRPSNYPEPFASLMQGRTKRPLGDLFNLKNFGVNLVHLPPGSLSALHHSHSLQDEFIYVLTDTLCVVLEVGDRSVGDSVTYPSDDIQAVTAVDGTWHFVHKDGSPYG